MFYERSRFPFTSLLESDWQSICDEYLGLPQDSFDPWVQQSMHGEGWSVYALAALGKLFPNARKRCPHTADVLARIPGISLAGFSRMAPHSHIRPHVGWAVNAYRVHLGLVVPDGCRLRVADETRPWKEGECLIFDDTVEHEAWNESDQVRGTWLIDVMLPGVSGFDEHMVPEEVRRYAEQFMEQ
jgi:aspartyl/asparaginyl beta-hydroxylase (cupin superfamily)